MRDRQTNEEGKEESVREREGREREEEELETDKGNQGRGEGGPDAPTIARTCMIANGAMTTANIQVVSHKDIDAQLQREILRRAM